MAQERILNPLKRKVMRRRFPVAETRFGIGFVVVLAAAGVWILAQKDNYDPADRDISMEVLEQDAVEDTLYHPPLKIWSEAGSGGGSTAGPDLGIFPAAVLDGGWSVDGRVETYDPETLYEKINGAAEQYLSFGFKKLHYVTITDGEYFVTVELYDQGAFPNTLGIFAAQRDEQRQISTEGDLFYYPTPVGAVAGIGRYYIKIAADSEASEATTKAAGLVPVLSALSAGESSTPRPFTILTTELGMAFDQLAYVPQDAFQYAFANDFWFATEDTAAEARVFIHQASSDEAAKALFAQLVEEQTSEYSVIETRDDRALFQHDFLETFFAVEREGPFVFGIDGAADRPAAERAAARIREAVDG